MGKETWLIAHFSPTGATARVARMIAEGTGCETMEWDLTKPGEQAPAESFDALMLALPVYGGRVPQLALERLRRLRGENTPAVAVAVYGNRHYDDALADEKAALTENGFRVIAAGAFIGEHSIVRAIGAGRPDEKDREAALRFGEAIERKVEAGDLEPVEVPGTVPTEPPKGSSVHPAANEDCIFCGICAETCPAEAIPVDAPNTTDGTLCINCMRCIQVCPVGARSLPEKFVAGAAAMLREKASEYRKPEVFL